MPPSSPPHDTPFLLLFPYPSAYLRPLSLSLSLSPPPFSSFLFFSFFYFLSRSLSRRIFFAGLFEEIRGTTNGRGNETDNRTAVPSRGRICLPFGSRAVSVEGGEREERRKSIPCVDLYRPLYTRFVSSLFFLLDSSYFRDLLPNCLEREWNRPLERENDTRRFDPNGSSVPKLYTFREKKRKRSDKISWNLKIESLDKGKIYRIYKILSRGTSCKNKELKSIIRRKRESEDRSIKA